MKKTGLLFILVILFISSILSDQVLSLQITEIMFNPEGADTGREWIEIELNSSDGCINLTEYKLFEEGTNHNIYKYNSDVACEFAIITSDVTKFLQDYTYINNTDNFSNISIYKSTFSLSNTGENIAIKKGTEIIDEINYTLLIENIDVTEGHSLEYYYDYNYNNYWRSSELMKGNPGNKIIENKSIEREINNSEEIIVNNETTNETSNRTINETINENINITDTENNITVEVNTSYNISRCNVTINLLIKNSSTVYESGNSIKFQNKIEINNLTNNGEIGEEYIIEYWIEDLFGNIIKNKVSTNNQDDKSFTPKIDEEDKILIIKNVLKNFSCNNCCNSFNNIINTSEKIILIKNSNYVPSSSSKQSSCSACESKKTSTESSSSYSYVCPIYAQNVSQPLIKIINVCNTSKENLESKNKNTLQNATQSLVGLSQTNQQNNLQAISVNTSSKTPAQNTGKTTSMVIYESPNLKNRLYALIGLVLVGLTCISFIVYKIILKASTDRKIE